MVNDVTYYYRFTYKYYNSNNTCKSTLKVFTSDDKNNPLVFVFNTVYDAIFGNPLNSGIAIGEEKNINLNHPKWAKLLILYGIEKGWNGFMKLEIEGNYDMLIQLEKV